MNLGLANMHTLITDKFTYNKKANEFVAEISEVADNIGHLARGFVLKSQWTGREIEFKFAGLQYIDPYNPDVGVACWVFTVVPDDQIRLGDIAVIPTLKVVLLND
jgi:hypothetical protein